MKKNLFVLILTILILSVYPTHATTRKVTTGNIHNPYITNEGYKTETTTKYIDGKLVSKTVTRTKIKNQSNNNYNIYYGSPICTEGNRMCALGDYILQTNGLNDYVYADYGKICTSDGSICTNGNYVLQTSRVVRR